MELEIRHKILKRAAFASSFHTPSHATDLLSLLLKMHFQKQQKQRVLLPQSADCHFTDERPSVKYAKYVQFVHLQRWHFFQHN